MRKTLLSLVVCLILVSGWLIQHVGAGGASSRIHASTVATESDYTSDAAQRSKSGAPRHWSAMVLAH